MCWYGIKGEFTSQILTEPKTVYKIVDNVKGQCKSYYKGYAYEKDACYSTMFNLVDSLGCIRIDDGFHSYNSLDMIYAKHEYAWKYYHIVSDGNFVDAYYGENMAIGHFTIPSGATVYVNKRGEVVSDQIVFRGFVEMDGNMPES